MSNNLGFINRDEQLEAEHSISLSPSGIELSTSIISSKLSRMIESVCSSNVGSKILFITSSH